MLKKFYRCSVCGTGKKFLSKNRLSHQRAKKHRYQTISWTLYLPDTIPRCSKFLANEQISDQTIHETVPDTRPVMMSENQQISSQTIHQTVSDTHPVMMSENQHISDQTIDETVPDAHPVMRSEAPNDVKDNDNKTMKRPLKRPPDSQDNKQARKIVKKSGSQAEVLKKISFDVYDFPMTMDNKKQRGKNQHISVQTIHQTVPDTHPVMMSENQHISDQTIHQTVPDAHPVMMSENQHISHQTIHQTYTDTHPVMRSENQHISGQTIDETVPDTHPVMRSENQHISDQTIDEIVRTYTDTRPVIMSELQLTDDAIANVSKWLSSKLKPKKCNINEVLVQLHSLRGLIMERTSTQTHALVPTPLRPGYHPAPERHPTPHNAHPHLCKSPPAFIIALQTALTVEEIVDIPFPANFVVRSVDNKMICQCCPNRGWNIPPHVLDEAGHVQQLWLNLRNRLKCHVLLETHIRAAAQHQRHLNEQNARVLTHFEVAKKSVATNTMSFDNEEGAGTSQDSDLLKRFIPVMLLSVEDVRRLKRVGLRGVSRR